MKPTTQLTCVRFQIFQKLVKRHGFRQKPDETPENFSGEYGHYQLGRKLGAGAYGTVYLATEQQSGTHHGRTSGIRDPKKSLAFFSCLVEKIVDKITKVLGSKRGFFRYSQQKTLVCKLQRGHFRYGVLVRITRVRGFLTA